MIGSITRLLSKIVSKTMILSILVVGLVVLNTLTLINAGVHDLLYRGLSALPLSSLLANSPTERRAKLKKENTRIRSERDVSKLKSAQLNKKLNSNKRNTKKVTERISKRLIRNTAMNMTSIPAESIPFMGVGVVVLVTAIDIKDACDTMSDMNEMMRFQELDELNDESSTICGHKINFETEYEELSKDVDTYMSHLKVKSENDLTKFSNAVGGTAAILVDKVRKDAATMNDKLGGTIYFMIN